MKGYLDEIEDRGIAKGLAQGIAKGKIMGAVDILLTMNFDIKAIKTKINQSYPNLDPKKLDQIIAEQKK